MGKDYGKLQDVPFFEAAWETVRQVEREHEVDISIDVIPQKRKGVFLIHVMASDIIPGVNFNRVVARCRVEFPNGRLTTFAGTLFDVMLSMDRLCSDYRETFGPRAPQHKA